MLRATGARTIQYTCYKLPIANTTSCKQASPSIATTALCNLLLSGGARLPLECCWPTGPHTALGCLCASMPYGWHLACQRGLHESIQGPLFIRCPVQQPGGDATGVPGVVTPARPSPFGRPWCRKHWLRHVPWLPMQPPTVRALASTQATCGSFPRGVVIEQHGERTVTLMIVMDLMV